MPPALPHGAAHAHEVCLAVAFPYAHHRAAARFLRFHKVLPLCLGSGPEASPVPNLRPFHPAPSVIGVTPQCPAAYTKRCIGVYKQRYILGGTSTRLWVMLLAIYGRIRGVVRGGRVTAKHRLPYAIGGLDTLGGNAARVQPAWIGSMPCLTGQKANRDRRDPNHCQGLARSGTAGAVLRLRRSQHPAVQPLAASRAPGNALPAALAPFLIFEEHPLVLVFVRLTRILGPEPGLVLAPAIEDGHESPKVSRRDRPKNAVELPCYTSCSTRLRRLRGERRALPRRVESTAADARRVQRWKDHEHSHLPAAVPQLEQDHDVPQPLKRPEFA